MKEVCAQFCVTMTMQKQLVLEPEKCIDCKTCTLLCSREHFGQYNPDLSAVTVFHFPEEALSVPVMCLQCDEPVCEKVCPTHAITRGADGVVRLDENRCIGCKFCVQSCPTGMVIHSPLFNKIFKCDLCGGQPLCATWCPTGAIKYGESPAGTDRRKAVAEKFKDAVKPEIEQRKPESERLEKTCAPSRFYNV